MGKGIEKELAFDHIFDVLHLCFLSTYRRATKFITPNLVVRCSARQKCRKNATRQEFVVTIGCPNYRERIFVKKCIAAKELFPVSQPQVKEWPKTSNRNGRS
jgi:hypothetical protein